MEKDTKGPAFRFRFHLPDGKEIQTGYGAFWPEKPLDAGHYKALAQQAGFRIGAVKEQPGGFQTFSMELRKPA